MTSSLDNISDRGRRYTRLIRAGRIEAAGRLVNINGLEKSTLLHAVLSPRPRDSNGVVNRDRRAVTELAEW